MFLSPFFAIYSFADAMSVDLFVRCKWEDLSLDRSAEIDPTFD